jgi:beta-lactam-binding protein with PASTA domain
MWRILPPKAGKLPGRWGWKGHNRFKPDGTWFVLFLACSFALCSINRAWGVDGSTGQEGRPRQGGSWSPPRSFSIPAFEFNFGQPAQEPEPSREEPTRTQPPQSDQVIVPDVRGKTQGRAASILAGARLQVGRVAKRVDNWPPGTVLQQSPEPGTRVSPYTPVNLWIVEPPPVTKIRVPDLTGQTQGRAANTLARLRLQLGRVGRVTSDEPSDTVVDQNPEPGTEVPPRTLVHIRIAMEPVRVKVPDLRGQTEREAANTLGQAELRMGRVARRTSDRTPNTVVDQNPKAGRLVRPSFRVQVWLAEAPPTPPAPLTPSLPPTTSPPLPPAEAQGPPSLGGTPGPTGGILATPSLPEPPNKVQVPNLVGKKRDLARQLLLEAGLQEGDVVTRKADLESDIIMVQTPEPGAMVLPGTPVVLVIAFREPARTGWPWGVILVVLVILAGGYYVAKRLIGKVLLPFIQVRPKPDEGIQHLALDTPLHLDLEVRLRPIMDQGEQELEVSGPLILEEGEKS